MWTIFYIIKTHIHENWDSYLFPNLVTFFISFSNYFDSNFSRNIFMFVTDNSRFHLSWFNLILLFWNHLIASKASYSNLFIKEFRPLSRQKMRYICKVTNLSKLRMIGKIIYFEKKRTKDKSLRNPLEQLFPELNFWLIFVLCHLLFK